MVQCQLQALQDSKQITSHSDKSEKELPCSADVLAAQQLLELSKGKDVRKIGMVGPKQEVKLEVKLNGLVRPFTLLVKEELCLLPVNGDNGNDIDESGDGGGCKACDISEGGISGGDDGSVGDRTVGEGGGISDGEDVCVSSSNMLGVLAQRKSWDSLAASEHCDRVPPDPPDTNGYSAQSSTTNHAKLHTEMGEEAENEGGVERQEDQEVQEESMDVQTEPLPHPWENLLGMQLIVWCDDYHQ